MAKTNETDKDKILSQVLLDIEKLDNCYKYGYNCVVENIDKIKEALDL